MTSRRRQLLESTDIPWMPAALRESITETLSRGLRWGRVFEGVAPVFSHFLERAGSREVLDCASGAGEPICILLDALARAGQPLPDVLLSDLFPHREALERLAARRGPGMSFVPEPVDATHVPEHLQRPVRTYINCLHHFPPGLVSEILADCGRTGAAVFVLEAFPNRLGPGLCSLPPLALAMLANPLLCRGHRLQKALLTLPLPVIPALGIWDLLVSIQRVHSAESLHALARAAIPAGYQWQAGEVPYPLGGRAFYFFGVPG